MKRVRVPLCTSMDCGLQEQDQTRYTSLTILRKCDLTCSHHDQSNTGCGLVRQILHWNPIICITLNSQHNVIVWRPISVKISGTLVTKAASRLIKVERWTFESWSLHVTSSVDAPLCTLKFISQGVWSQLLRRFHSLFFSQQLMYIPLIILSLLADNHIFQGASKTQWAHTCLLLGPSVSHCRSRKIRTQSDKS